MSESLDALAAAGIPVDAIDEEKRAVLSELSPEETRVLVGIIDKMSSEVEGFAFQMGSLATPAIRPTVRPGATLPGDSPAIPGLDPGALADTGGVFW
jgi:hypothetical protein